MIAADLQVLFDDHIHFHSAYQMDNFITFRTGLTAYGCYRQALREWHGRLGTLITTYISLESRRVDLEELKAAEGGSAYDVRRRRLTILDTEYRLANDIKMLRDTEREFRHFLGQVVALKEQVGDLTPDRIAKYEEELWVVRVKAAAATDYICTGILKQSTVEMLQATPAKNRHRLVKEICVKHEERGPLLDWFLALEQPKVHKPIDVDVKELCCELSNLPLLLKHLPATTSA